MDACSIKGYSCPVEYTLDIIGGKWKTVLLYQLAHHKILRYGQLKKALSSITHKTLSNQLKELEADGLVHREEYQQIPPKVEYSLTEKGLSVLPVLTAMCAWGAENMPKAAEDIGA